jgi:membrane associated rhomboid family serine protease
MPRLTVRKPQFQIRRCEGKFRIKIQLGRQVMKPRSARAGTTGLFILVVSFLISSLISSTSPVQAQTTAVTARSAVPFNYDIAEEVTVTGTVSSVLTHAAPEMIVGSHLLLATPAGPVDASLGRFGLQGYGAVSAAAGQQIEATGVMKTIKDKPVLLVRIVKVGGQLYTIRNEHGVLLSPHARERAVQKASQKGESL